MLQDRINVTKTFLPPIEEYKKYIDQIWQRAQLTNQGPLLIEFEDKLKQRLGVDDIDFVSNGTIALQIALKALGIGGGEVITTPFSYVASVSSILWERCEPVFVDIEPNTFCIDASKIEKSITNKTKAILAVHVFGFPCDIEKIDAIAKKYSLKVIYDGAHAFGVNHGGKSLLSYGDISTCSFHATKLFHTIEGGCIISKDKSVADKVELMKRFGHNYDEHTMLGINGKVSEFHAAMGLCNLKYVDDLIEERKHLSSLYDKQLSARFPRPKLTEATEYNYAYYPIVMESKTQVLKTLENLNQENIFPRRYFYPSLNTLPYIEQPQSCPVSEDIASRIICLPLYSGLKEEIINKICGIIKK